MSVHIPYDQSPMPYHQVVAGLVCKYAAKDASVLDIGCGVGHCLAIVREQRRDIGLTAADIDMECLRITNERVGLDGKLLVSNVEELFVGDVNFDGIVMSHSLEHMISPVLIVQGVMRRLKPGGFLILAVPNPVRLNIIISNIRRRKNVNLGHVMAWDRSHWMNFVEVIMKLNVLEYAEDYFPLPRQWGDRHRWVRWLELRLVRMFPWFSLSNIVVVRKQKLLQMDSD
jgi:ubiquinone/menaquinone biosynthesis C-methylase UbiE